MISIVIPTFNRNQYPYTGGPEYKKGIFLKIQQESDSNFRGGIQFVTNYSQFDVQDIVENANLVVDLRNAVKFESEKVYKF